MVEEVSLFVCQFWSITTLLMTIGHLYDYQISVPLRG